jgi:hypothetical protein
MIYIVEKYIISKDIDSYIIINGKLGNVKEVFIKRSYFVKAVCTKTTY